VTTAEDDATLRRFTNLHLDALTLWVPDDMIPAAREPAWLAFWLHADHVTWLSQSTRWFAPIGLETRALLVDAALAVLRGGDQHAGADTASGRLETRFELSATLPATSEAVPRGAGLRINHIAYGGCRRGDWATLFSVLEAVAGTGLAAEDARKLRWVRQHFVHSSVR
jgi:hypothetical protein